MHIRSCNTNFKNICRKFWIVVEIYFYMIYTRDVSRMNEVWRQILNRLVVCVVKVLFDYLTSSFSFLKKRYWWFSNTMKIHRHFSKINTFEKNLIESRRFLRILSIFYIIFIYVWNLLILTFCLQYEYISIHRQNYNFIYKKYFNFIFYIL